MVGHQESVIGKFPILFSQAGWGVFYFFKMEILAIIGIIVVGLVIFTGGGLLGWCFKGLGAIFEFLAEGWGSCLRVIVWIFLILLLLIALAL